LRLISTRRARLDTSVEAAAKSACATLVIGCGNADRGDDAAGILVARRLRELGIDAREHTGDGLALIESWSGAERVILVDTVVTGAPPGTIRGWLGADAALIREKSASTHGFGVAEGIELARVLHRMPASLTIYGIEGRMFERGAQASPEVLESVEKLANQILGEVRRQT
jgi:hydrogenase maturation protease